MTGYCYFILNEGTGHIKIGYSVNPNKRIKTLQTGSSDVLTLLYVVEGTKTTERYLHRRFSADRLRDNSEWFNYSYDIKMWILNDKIIKKNKL